MTDTKKRRPHALPTLTGLLCLVVLVPWLLCMGLLTAAVAQGEGNALAIRYSDQARQQVIQSSLPWGQVDGWGWNARYFLGASGLFDAMGNPLGGSWQDFLVARTLTPEEWEGDAGVPSGQVIVHLDREKLTDTGRQYIGESARLQIRFDLRLTGVLDGMELTPTRIDGIPWDWEEGDVFQEVTLYENPEAVPAGGETVTLYTSSFSLCCPHSIRKGGGWCMFATEEGAFQVDCRAPHQKGTSPSPQRL